MPVLNWLTVLKYGLPIALLAAFYFWAHDAGWKDRDSTVATEKQSAVDAAVKGERDACTAETQKLGGINAKLYKGLEKANNLYADAVGSLYDTRHIADPAAGVAGAAGSDNGAASGGRLYYADPAGAVPALSRAQTATKQAEQLIGCQSYINGVRGIKETPAP